MRGRATGTHVSILFPGSLPVARIYGDVGTGMESYNLELYDHLSEQVAKLKGRWVIGGDFNALPQRMQELAAI